MGKIHILVADDHPLFREGVRAMLHREPEIHIVGEATTGAEAIARAQELKPDVILMDLHMPEVNGIEATRTIVHGAPETRILVLTMFEDDDSVFAALRAGARGYLLKGADKAEVVRAIQAVAQGEAIFGPRIAQRLMTVFATDVQALLPPPLPELTDREREILTLIAAGSSNTAIAQQLVVSLKTVRNHVSNIFSKLQIVDRQAAVSRARDAGLGQGPSFGRERR